MEAILATVLAAVWALACLYFGRFMLALHFCMQANHMLADYLRAEIRAGRADMAEVRKQYDRLEATSQVALAIDLSVWSTKAAFPWLFELRGAQVAA